jgi:hypothetical protein
MITNRLPISPYRLNREYRDFWGEPQSAHVKDFDKILESGCYRPRFFHAPDTVSELAGLPADGYLQYVLAITPGSFILGFRHKFNGQNWSPNNYVVAPGSGYFLLNPFLVQITDVRLDHRLFSQPVPDAYFIGFGAGVSGVGGPMRSMVKPYPVVPPGHFLVEFWNQFPPAPAVPPYPNNFQIQLTLVVAEPDPEFMEASK